MHNYVIQASLWSKVKRPEDPDRFYKDCWNWVGNTMVGNGGCFYGRFQYRDKQYAAHRVAYELGSGQPIPDGHVVRHTCNNSLCCNPLHLKTGTHADNVADRVAARRSATGLRNGAYTKPERVRKGETHGNSTLTEQDVKTIRFLAATSQPFGYVSVLSEMFKVPPGNICLIRDRVAWASVEPDPDFTPAPEVQAQYQQRLEAARIKHEDKMQRIRNGKVNTPEEIHYTNVTRWAAKHCKPGWYPTLGKLFGVCGRTIGGIATGEQRKTVPFDPDFVPCSQIQDILRPWLKTDEKIVLTESPTPGKPEDVNETEQVNAACS